ATSRQARGSCVVFPKPLRPLDKLEDRARFLIETSANQYTNKKSRLILRSCFKFINLVLFAPVFVLQILIQRAKIGFTGQKQKQK
ncbi:MAG: hypothetical protein RRY23_08240, partial [Alistipes sp.]